MSIINSTIEKLDLKRFFQGEGPQAQPIHFHQRRVYILPTRQGYVFALLLLIMLVGSINYSNSLGYMLTFLLASLTVMTILYTYRNLLNLKVSIGNIEPVYCQQNITVPFHFNSILYDRFSVSIQYGMKKKITF